MKIAIVEDDDRTAADFANLVTAYGQQHDLTLQLTRFTDGLGLVDHYRPEFDVIYLDVQMAHMDGMTAAKRIRQQERQVLIVFVTNYVQYAIDGYAVNALDFLLKPVTAFAFAEHFKKVAAKLAVADVPSLTLRIDGELVKLPINELTYIESNGHYLTVHTTNQDFSLIESLKNIEETLLPHHFFRCNNSYLVNLAQVTGIQDGDALVAGTPLRISRPRKKAFMQALTDYLGDELL